MLETMLTTCCQIRLSGELSCFSGLSFYNFFLETLRRPAEATMHTLVRMVFSKLHQLDPEEEEAILSSVTEDEALEVE